MTTAVVSTRAVFAAVKTPSSARKSTILLLNGCHAWANIRLLICAEVEDMAEKKIVHIVGTGTIGEPLIGILSTFREQFVIDEVTFHKRTPLLTDRSKVLVSCSKGARLAVDKERWQKFADMGMTPALEAEEAIERANVIIDCTPVGN